MMVVHVIIGCDGEVFATLLSAKLTHIEAAMDEFEGRIGKLMNNQEAALNRSQALTVLAGADYSRETDPDAESFVAFLVREYGMDPLEHDTYKLPN